MLKSVSLVAIILVSLCGYAVAEPNVIKVSRNHYTGTWLEIARRPMWLTNGCVAGFTRYELGKEPNEVAVLDGCHEGSPTGRLKTVRGKGQIQDAGTKRAKLKVRYPFFFTFDYWVLYQSPDRSWFISADPSMRNLWIYARRAPNHSRLKQMVRKASELGYDVNKLEFPATR